MRAQGKTETADRMVAWSRQRAKWRGLPFPLTNATHVNFWTLNTFIWELRTSGVLRLGLCSSNLVGAPGLKVYQNLSSWTITALDQ